MRHRNILIALIVFTTAACMSDEEIRKEIRDRGGKIVERGKTITLTGENGNIEIGARASGGISAKHGARCRRKCWASIRREFVDNTLVTDFEKYEGDALDNDPAARRLAQHLNRKQINGWVVDRENITYSECQINYETADDWFDDPNTPDEFFEQTDYGFSPDLALTEFETCRRCIVPPSPDWEGCFRWYYVKVRADKTGRPRSYVVTTGRTAAPTQTFRQVVEKWKTRP